MPVYIFIATMGMGGSQRVCINLANEFARQGREVHIIVLHLKKDVNSNRLDERCKLHVLGVDRLRYASLPMLKFIKRNQVDKIIVFGKEMAIILNQLKKMHLITTKVVLRNLNNVEIALDKEDNISPIVEKYLVKAQKQMKNMDFVISQCYAMGEMLLQNNYVDIEHSKVIYNPVSQSIVEQTNRADCASTENKNVVFIGRIDPQKNIEHLIRAFGMVVAKRENINLIVVGDGVQKEKIVKLIAELNLEEKVQMVGVRRDIERIYEVADLVVLSSVYEGMPNCLIEAIAVGIPVVSYDCPIGPKEIIKDNQNGFLVPYNDMEALAIKIIEALDKKWDVKLIKETAEKFQVEKIAKEYLEIYDKV